jgi:hypothetical protein
LSSCLALPCLVLSSCLVLSCLALSCLFPLSLSCLVLSCLVCLGLSCIGLACLVFQFCFRFSYHHPNPISGSPWVTATRSKGKVSYIVLYCLVLSCIASSCLVLSCLALPCLAQRVVSCRVVSCRGPRLSFHVVFFIGKCSCFVLFSSPLALFWVGQRRLCSIGPCLSVCVSESTPHARFGS